MLTLAILFMVACATGSRRSLTVARLLSVSEAKWMLQSVNAAAMMPAWTGQIKRATNLSVHQFVGSTAELTDATTDVKAAADAHAQAPAPGPPAPAGVRPLRSQIPLLWKCLCALGQNVLKGRARSAEGCW